MTAEEFKLLAFEHLDRCDEADREDWAREQPDADWFADAHSRWLQARQAFPGMDWQEFCEFDVKRKRKGKRGRPKRSVSARADEPVWRAARDADRIKQLWAALHPERPRPNPPVHPHQLAAERHGVIRQTLDDNINRPDDRRIDRKTADK
ncbi:hypothetical protein [Qipengyuania nanhaisediminis]|uniref:hypothetical protein n=1 Tax=Qipengyuania nanhaisediminis TaxID=604088 RepID=UPI0038B3D241